MKRAIIVSVAAFALTAASVHAQQPLEYKVVVQAEIAKGAPGDHFLTFSAPVQIPEVSLPAGTYVFTIVAPSIVRVSSADRTQHYAMLHTLPVQRAVAGDDYEMVFARTDDAAPARIAKWFVPNQFTGFEFVYPKADVAGAR